MHLGTLYMTTMFIKGFKLLYQVIFFFHLLICTTLLYPILKHVFKGHWIYLIPNNCRKIGYCPKLYDKNAKCSTWVYCCSSSLAFWPMYTRITLLMYQLLSLLQSHSYNFQHEQLFMLNLSTIYKFPI